MSTTPITLSRETTRIDFEGFHDVLEPELRRLLSPWTWLIPPWCVSLLVLYAPDMDDCTLTLETQYDYRQATLRVSGSFFDSTEKADDEQRTLWLIHDLLHLSINQPFNFARDQFDELLDDAPKFGKCVRRQLAELTEQAVQDLAYLIYRNRKKQPTPGTDAPA